jgi:hypothetical protein
MWNSWTGISDETLAEAEAIVERANGEKAARALRPLCEWLRTTLTYRQLLEAGCGWSSVESWSENLDFYLPLVAETLYAAFVVPVRERKPRDEDDAFCRRVFGHSIVGCVDSFPVPASGPSAAYNGHYKKTIMKGLVAVQLGGLIEFAEGGFSGLQYDDQLLKLSTFVPCGMYLGDNHFKGPYISSMPANAARLKQLRKANWNEFLKPATRTDISVPASSIVSLRILSTDGPDSLHLDGLARAC